MKKQKWVAVIGAVLGVFLVVAFLCWDVNPGNWSGGLRFLTVWLAVLVAYPVAAFAGREQ